VVTILLKVVTVLLFDSHIMYSMYWMTYSTR